MIFSTGGKLCCTGFGDGETAGTDDASPGCLECAPNFFRSRRVGDGNYICIYK
jgi:hypothetical protein